jgi:hypothetical protein
MDLDTSMACLNSGLQKMVKRRSLKIGLKYACFGFISLFLYDVLINILEKCLLCFLSFVFFFFGSKVLDISQKGFSLSSSQSVLFL